jgi:hypothetical protein
MNTTWTYADNELVCDLFYLMMSKPAQRTTDPDLLDVAEMIGKTPGTVWMKLGNFLYLETEGKKGLANLSKDCRKAWDARREPRAPFGLAVYVLCDGEDVRVEASRI